MDADNNNESRREALLLGAVGPHRTATRGGLAPGVASASPIPTEGVSSMAPPVGNATAETDVPSGTQWKQDNTGYTETINNQKKDTTSSEEAGKRVTLVEKLLSSQKSPGRNPTVPMSTTDECFSKMGNADKTENVYFDRNGRRLQKMLEAVKTAKNIAKPVQQLLAEALDAYKHAKAPRTEQQEARACWINKMAEDQAKPEASRSPYAKPKNSSNIDSTLADISQELKALRKLATNAQPICTAQQQHAGGGHLVGGRQEGISCEETQNGSGNR